MTKQKLINYFIEILNVLVIKTVPQYPNIIFYVYKNKIYIQYTKNSNIAWLNYEKIWKVFKTNYSDNFQEIKEITSHILEEHFKLKEVTTEYHFNENLSELGKSLKLLN